MKTCCKCGKQVISGHIVCGECHGGHTITLRYFADQLAEEIVMDYKDTCSFCNRGECDSQQSGLTCRRNVKDFLLAKIEDYGRNLKDDLDKYSEQIAFLDSLHIPAETHMEAIRDKFGLAFPQMNDFQRSAILSLWDDTRAG